MIKAFESNKEDLSFMFENLSSELDDTEKKMENIVGDKKDIAWGSQIRSYILQPYRIVKDHRTSVEIGNVDAVLDGNIDAFIKAYLEKRVKEKVL